MRPRGSVTGPLILIVIGAIFLVHTLSPDFRVLPLLSHWWPYFLILWGVLQLVEVLLRAWRGGPIPLNGVSAVNWGLVFLIIVIGYGSWHWPPRHMWNAPFDFETGVQVFGDAHDYAINEVRQTVGKAPRVVIENFRGSAKVTGVAGSEVVVKGSKRIRAVDAAAAERANQHANVEAIVQGDAVVIRCSQNEHDDHAQVSADLDIAVPKDAVIEANAHHGELEIAGVKSVDVTGDHERVRVQNVDGDVKVSTDKSEAVRIATVKGSATVRGQGDDVDLSQVLGEASVVGDFRGTISLHAIAKPVRVESMRTQIEAQAVPGGLTLARGSLSVDNVTGPVKVNAEAADVSVAQVTDAVELNVDKGDIDLKPGRLPLPRMRVTTQSGEIDLALPARAMFALDAKTEHGEIDNQFGDVLKTAEQDHGARLEGTVGSGPELHLSADRGGITIRKDAAEASPAGAKL